MVRESIITDWHQSQRKKRQEAIDNAPSKTNPYLLKQTGQGDSHKQGTGDTRSHARPMDFGAPEKIKIEVTAITIKDLLGDTKFLKENSEKVKTLFQPDQFSDKETQQQKLEKNAKIFAALMASEFIADQGEMLSDNRDMMFVLNLFQVAVTKQVALTKQLAEPNEKGGYLEAVLPEAVETSAKQANAQHTGYIARGLSDAVGVDFFELREFLIDTEMLTFKDAGAVAMNLDKKFPGTNIGQIFKDKYASWAMIAESKNQKHLLLNMPGVYGGEALVQFGERIGFGLDKMRALFSHDKKTLLYRMVHGTKQERAALRLAAIISKTNWQVAALQRGLIENNPDRYVPTKSDGVVNTMIDSFEGMIKTESENDENNAVDLAIKDLDQSSSFLFNFHVHQSDKDEYEVVGISGSATNSVVNNVA